MRRDQRTQTSQNNLLLITSLLLFVIVNQQISQANANVVGSRFSPENLQAAQQAEAERVAKGKIAASRARLTTTNTEKTTDATSVEDVVVDILSDKVEGDGATPVKPQTIQRGTTLVDIAKRRNRQQLEKKASESQEEKSSGSETNEVKEEKKDEGMPRRFAQSLLNAGRAVDLGKLAVEAPNEEDAKNAREADITAQPTKTASQLLDDLAKNLSLNRKPARPAQQPSPVEPKSNRPSVSRQIDSEPSGGQSLLPPLLGQNLPAFRDPETRGKADHIPIDRLIHRHNRDGSYTFGYESMDGFKLETRLPDGQVVGRYGYYDATGQLKVIEYGADKDLGFVPKGDGIQVPPTVVRAESGNEISDQASGENQDPFLSVDFSGRDEPPPQRRPVESTPPPSPAFPAFQGFPQQQPFLQVLPGGFLQPQPAPGFGAPTAGADRPTFFFGQDGRLTSSGAEQQSGPTGFFAGPPQQQQQFIPGFINPPIQPVTNFQPRPLPPSSASSQPNTQENSPHQEQPQPNPQQEGANPQNQQPSSQPPQQPPQDNRFFFLPQQQATNLNSNPALVDPLFNQPIFQGFPPAFPGFNQPQQLIRPQNEQPRPTPSIFPGFQQPQQQRPFPFFSPDQQNNNQFINRPPPPFAGFGAVFRGEERQPAGFLAPFQRPGQPTSGSQQLESPGFFVRQQRERQFDNGFSSNPFFR